MGLFDFLKGKSVKEEEKRRADKRNIAEMFTLIDENMYVNEHKTTELLEQAYRMTASSVIDRHFLYNKMIDYYYGLREQKPDALDLCIKYCKESIKHTPEFLQSEKEEFRKYHGDKIGHEYIPPRIPAFQRLAIIYENENKYDEAIKICEIALSLNLKDGTKGGFEGRLVRLTKKLAK